MIRRREYAATVPAENSGFAAALAAKYRQRLSSETLMVNELYLSVVYRPIVGAAPGLLSRIVSKHAPQALPMEFADALDASEKLAQTVASSLARHEPERLEVYEKGGRHFFSVLEFFSLLLNAEWQPVPLPRAPLNEVLVTTRTIFRTSNQLLVDWFRFWLKNEEDPDPAKTVQYRCWCVLRSKTIQLAD